MKCIVIYNPSSGSTPGLHELRTIFSEQDYEVSKFIATGEDFEKRLKNNLTEKSLVAVVGGDGTIGSTIKHIIDTDSTLLPLPGGTLNHFTKDLGIDQDISQALQRAAKSGSRRIDVASINDHYFVNNSSLGLYPESLRVRSRFEDKLGKWPAALIGAARAMVSFHHYRLTIDGQAIVTPFVFIGNNHYDFSALKIGKRQRLDQGILTVAVTTTHTRFQLFKTFLLALIRKLEADNQLKLYTIHDTLTINSRRHSIHVSADGEVYKFKPPLTYKIHKKSLNILG